VSNQGVWSEQPPNQKINPNPTPPLNQPNPTPQVCTPAALARKLLRLQLLRAAAITTLPAEEQARGQLTRDCLTELSYRPDRPLPLHLLAAEDAWTAAQRHRLSGGWSYPPNDAIIVAQLAAEMRARCDAAARAVRTPVPDEATELFAVGADAARRRRRMDAMRAAYEAGVAGGGALLAAFTWEQAAACVALIEDIQKQQKDPAPLRKLQHKLRAVLECMLDAGRRSEPARHGGEEEDGGALKARAMRVLLQAGWVVDAEAQGAWCSLAAGYQSILAALHRFEPRERKGGVEQAAPTPSEM